MIFTSCDDIIVKLSSIFISNLRFFCPLELSRFGSLVGVVALNWLLLRLLQVTDACWPWRV
jgi:hypothetical protein